MNKTEIKGTRSKKLKLLPGIKEQLPNIYSPGCLQSFSRASSNKNPHSGKNIASNGEVHLQGLMHNKPIKPPVNKNQQMLHQIMIEFIPDKYYASSGTKVNFIANPVIPSFSIPANFPSLNLNVS